MCSKSARLTENSLLSALSETVRSLQGDRTDHEFAEEWGASEGSVLNARNKRHQMKLLHFLKLGKEYRSHGVDTALALVGLRSVPINSVTLDIGRVPHDVATCLPILIEYLSDGDWSDEDQRKFEEAGVVHCILNLADLMKEKRDARRLRSVQA